MEIEIADRKIKELHEYARHAFGLFMGWFTFFATVNYATMGWLAKPGSSPLPNTGLLGIVVTLFITQNLLGVAACFKVAKYFRSTNNRIISLETYVSLNKSTAAISSSLPIDLYIGVIQLIAGALIVIGFSWFAICKIA